VDYHQEIAVAKKLKPVHRVTRIAEIYHERRRITTDTALRLARYLNTSAAFWVNLPWRYELEIAEDREAARIARGVRPLEPASSR
jgi:antitoxin HigA-1